MTDQTKALIIGPALIVGAVLAGAADGAAPLLGLAVIVMAVAVVAVAEGVSHGRDTRRKRKD